MRSHVCAVAVLASAALYLASMGPAHAALDDAGAQALLKKSGCATCHKLDKDTVGPAMKTIAKKRKGQASAVDDMKKTVRNGGKGTYGSDAMPAFSADKISDADLNNLLQWIVSK